MEFSRAMLAASASVLGLLLYLVAALLCVLAIVSATRATAGGPAPGKALLVAAGFVVAGAGCRFIARRIS